MFNGPEPPGRILCPVLRTLGPAPKPLWCASEPSWGLRWPLLLALAPLIDMPENLPSISGIPDCRVTGRISGVSTKDEGTPWRPGRLQWIADTTPGVTAIPCECRWLRRGGARAGSHARGGGGGHRTAPG